MGSKRIKGKVARVLNAREIAINRGTEDGVTLGMMFAVLDLAGEGIVDPDTGEEIGSVYRQKIRVRIVDVRHRLSIGRTFERYQVNVGGAGIAASALSNVFEPPRYERRYKTLKSKEHAFEDISEAQSFVKTGDPVEQLVPHDDAIDEPQSHAADKSDSD